MLVILPRQNSLPLKSTLHVSIIGLTGCHSKQLRIILALESCKRFLLWSTNLSLYISFLHKSIIPQVLSIKNSFDNGGAYMSKSKRVSNCTVLPVINLTIGECAIGLWLDCIYTSYTTQGAAHMRHAVPSLNIRPQTIIWMSVVLCVYIKALCYRSIARWVCTNYTNRGLVHFLWC